MCGRKDEVDPVSFLIGSAGGWGGNPPSAAVYVSVFPKDNDGNKAHRLTVKDVPVDGFWSLSVYNAKGFFEKNDLGCYSLNNLTDKPSADGSFTIQFGGDPKSTPNYLPITPGWNYTVRLNDPEGSNRRHLEVPGNAAGEVIVPSLGDEMVRLVFVLCVSSIAGHQAAAPARVLGLAEDRRAPVTRSVLKFLICAWKKSSLAYRKTLSNGHGS
jgi:hypothetical protein